MMTYMQPQKQGYLNCYDLQSLRQMYCNVQPVKRQTCDMTYGCSSFGKRKIDSTLFSWKKKDEYNDYLEEVTRRRNEQNGIITKNDVDNSRALVVYTKPIDVLETLGNMQNTIISSQDSEDEYSDSNKMELCDFSSESF